MSYFRLVQSALVFLALIACRHSGPLVDDLVQLKQEQVLQAVIKKTDKMPFDRLIVFGDSLSDTGNLHRNSFGLYSPHNVYWQGRLSNGPIWLDYVAAAWNIEFNSYAVAAAATESYNFFVDRFVATLNEQLNTYLKQRSREKSKRRDLIVIWIGANNYLSQGLSDVKPALQAIYQVASQLLQLDLEAVVIGNLPELSGLPKPYKGHHLLSDKKLAELSRLHNRALARLVTDLQRKFLSKKVILFQSYRINQRTNSNPESFAFRNISEPCYRGDFRGNFYGRKEFCKQPMQQKFWDYVHPNSLMHCYYAAQFIYDCGQSFRELATSLPPMLAACRRLAVKK